MCKWPLKVVMASNNKWMCFNKYVDGENVNGKQQNVKKQYRFEIRELPNLNGVAKSWL